MYNIKSYVEAQNIEQAIQALSGNANAQIIAGGTDILIKSREHKTGYIERDLIGITRIPQMQEIKVDAGGAIFIGAAMTFTNIEKNKIICENIPSLATAVGTVGGPQVRNTGTIGGNVCNGATSADSASTLFALNAKIIVQNLNGQKEIPIAEFYLGPGKVALQQGDLVTCIKIERADYQGYRGHYIKFSPRSAMDIATLGCSVLIKVEGETIQDLRIAFGVAGPTPIRASEAEAFARGKKTDEQTLETISELCLKNARARDSWRSSKAFREQLITELPKRAIKFALGGAN